MTVVDGRSQYGRRSGRAPFQNTIGGFYGSYANFKPGGTLPSYYSVTRASVDYAWDGTQFVQVASGTPSFWYGKGLAVFGAATNLARWSSDLSNGAYIYSTTATSATSIVQGGTARTLTAPSSVNTYLAVTPTPQVGAFVQYFLINNVQQITTVSLELYNNGATSGSVSVNLSTGVGGTWGICTASGAIPIGGGSYIVWAACTGTGTGGRVNAFFLRQYGVSTAGDACTFQHHQLVTGTRILPPIVTNAATASRAADVISIAIANLPWLSASPSALYLGAQIELLQIPDSIVSAFDLNDGTGSNTLDLYINGATASCNTVAGGVTSAAINGTFASGVSKAAMSSTANSFLAAFNGVAGTADVSGSMPTGLSTLNIGHARGGFQLQGFIGSIYAGPTTQAQAWLNGRTSSSSY